MRQLKSCFGFDTFFATDVRRFGDGGIFIGNLRKPIEEVIPKLEKKLSEAAGREVVLWFMEEKTNDITKQVHRRELMYIPRLCRIIIRLDVDILFWRYILGSRSYCYCGHLWAFVGICSATKWLCVQGSAVL